MRATAMNGRQSSCDGGASIAISVGAAAVLGIIVCPPLSVMRKYLRKLASAEAGSIETTGSVTTRPSHACSASNRTSDVMRRVTKNEGRAGKVEWAHFSIG